MSSLSILVLNLWSEESVWKYALVHVNEIISYQADIWRTIDISLHNRSVCMCVLILQHVGAGRNAFLSFYYNRHGQPQWNSPCYLFRLPENGDCRRVKRDSEGCGPWGGLKRTRSLVLSTADLGIGPFFVVLFTPHMLVMWLASGH